MLPLEVRMMQLSGRDKLSVLQPDLSPFLFTPGGKRIRISLSNQGHPTKSSQGEEIITINP
jgi:hypothetical protein